MALAGHFFIGQFYHAIRLPSVYLDWIEGYEYLAMQKYFTNNKEKVFYIMMII